MGKRRTASRRLLQDGELLSEIEATRHTLQLARIAEKTNPQGLASEVPRLERSLEEMTERAAREAVLFVCQTIPADDFDDIARRHPPTPEELERWREQAKVNPFASMPEFNVASMGPDLLEACLVEPDWGSERIGEWWRDASKGERNQLWNLALSVQVEGADVPFSAAAIGTTDDGGEPSSSPASGESPSPSS
jgi:hypothetical protein